MQHEGLVEEQAALSKRMHKLSGRFYRDLRGTATAAADLDADAAPERDPHTVDALTGSTDTELAAMLALQAQHTVQRQ